MLSCFSFRKCKLLWKGIFWFFKVITIIHHFLFFLSHKYKKLHDLMAQKITNKIQIKNIGKSIFSRITVFS